MEPNKLLVVVTGLSGAGKSIAIKALEDSSFYCIDNLPVEILELVTDHFIANAKNNSRFAVGMDIRNRAFAKSFLALKEKISAKIKMDVIYLTADEEVIVQRYSTTRRKHPLLDEGGELLSAIRRENDILAPVEQTADVKFDTSSWSPHFLARSLENRYAKEIQARNLYVTVVSFGFKYGILRQADSIYDVRFLKNPYFDQALKEHSGLDKRVQDYILEEAQTKELMDRLIDFHRFLLPSYYNEGKHYFRIGIGCTGGKHRSVVVAEELAARIAKEDLPNILVSVGHRDIDATLKPIF